MERPNNGVNIVSPSVGLSIYPNRRAKYIKSHRKISLDKPVEVSLMAGYGNHQRNASIDDPNYFAVAGLMMGLAKNHNNFYRSRIGLDFNYVWSLTVKEDGSQANPGWSNLTLGAIYQPEFFIGKFSLFGGVGMYMKHHGYGDFNQLYQRLGLRYNFSKEWSLAANIRSVNFYEAEFLEFQLGYHF